MKTCGVCGTLNNDNNQFCINCGQKLEQNQPAEAGFSASNPPDPPYVQPVPPVQPTDSAPFSQANQMPPSEMYYNGQSPNAAFGFAPAQLNVERFQRIREIASSNLMLALVVLWFVQIALSLLSIIFGNAATQNNLLDSGVFGEEQIGFINSLSSFSLFSSIPALIPTTLIGIGILLTYRMASNNTVPLGTSGITIIRVVSIIQFVFVCIGIALALILGILLLSGGASGIVGEAFGEFLSDLGDLGYNSFDGSAYGESVINGALGFVGTIILILALIFGGLAIGFFILLIKFLGSVLQTISTGFPQEKCASALSVIFFILGGFSALGVFGSLSELAFSPASGLLSLSVSGVSSATFFLIGIIINKYRSAVYSF